MSTQKTPLRNSKPTSQKNLALSEGLLITGMHRSGTSMIAGLVEKCGVNQLGKNPMSAAADNPDGFFEDVALVKISDEILRLSEGSWNVPSIPSKTNPQKGKLSESLIQTARKEVFQLRQDVAEPWFIKDPRICLTITEWKRILLLKTPLIFIVRNPHDVATSLMQRSNMKSKRALAIWYRYNYALLKSVERDQILVLDYDLTCGKPGAVQAGVESFLESVLSRGDNSKFEIEEQVIFNPRNYSRSVDFNDRSLSKESKDCFDLYRKISQFHLKTRLTSLKLFAEPTWVEEELDIAQDEAFAAAQLEDLNNKAEYLFTELGAARNQVAERETELNQLRAETEQQRAELETQLEENRAKAEYLFTELGAARNQVAERETELNQLRAETEQQRAELETQLEENRAKAEFLFTELQNSKTLTSERETELNQLRAETEQQRAELETQLKENRAKAEFLFTELGAARNQVAERETELNQLRAETEQQRAELETQLEENRAKAEYLFTELGAARNQVAERETELNQLRAETEQQRAELETQLEENRAKAEYLFTELGAARNQVAERETELNQLRAETEQQRAELETQLEENRAKAEFLFTELQNSKTLTSERETELNQLRAETEQQRAELETQLEENRAKAEYLFTELGAARNQVAERETELNQLRAETEQQRAELETQLEENRAKAEYLFTELGAARNQVAERETELNQLRAETEQQRAELETQLEENRAKAEFLFTELGAARNQVAERDRKNHYLNQINKSSEQELIRLAVALRIKEHQSAELEKAKDLNRRLTAVAYNLFEDNQKLTKMKAVQMIRKFRIAMRNLQTKCKIKTTVRHDVIPIKIDKEEYFSIVIQTGFNPNEYLNANPDVKQSGVNPYTHYVQNGRFEGRNLSQI